MFLFQFCLSIYFVKLEHLETARFSHNLLTVHKWKSQTCQNLKLKLFVITSNVWMYLNKCKYLACARPLTSAEWTVPISICAFMLGAHSIEFSQIPDLHYPKVGRRVAFLIRLPFYGCKLLSTSTHSAFPSLLDT